MLEIDSGGEDPVFFSANGPGKTDLWAKPVSLGFYDSESFHFSLPLGINGIKQTNLPNKGVKYIN